MEKTIYSEAYTAFCRILRKTRVKRGITQAALARALARPQSFVAKVESGQRRVDIVELIVYAKRLKIPPTKLLTQLLAEISQQNRRRPRLKT